jgi:hypothetical protein
MRSAARHSTHCCKNIPGLGKLTIGVNSLATNSKRDSWAHDCCLSTDHLAKCVHSRKPAPSGRQLLPGVIYLRHARVVHRIMSPAHAFKSAPHTHTPVLACHLAERSAASLVQMQKIHSAALLKAAVGILCLVTGPVELCHHGGIHSPQCEVQNLNIRMSIVRERERQLRVRTHTQAFVTTGPAFSSSSQSFTPRTQLTPLCTSLPSSGRALVVPQSQLPTQSRHKTNNDSLAPCMTVTEVYDA